jgi:hypothetical protein
MCLTFDLWLSCLSLFIEMQEEHIVARVDFEGENGELSA